MNKNLYKILYLKYKFPKPVKVKIIFSLILFLRKIETKIGLIVNAKMFEGLYCFMILFKKKIKLIIFIGLYEFEFNG